MAEGGRGVLRGERTVGVWGGRGLRTVGGGADGVGRVGGTAVEARVGGLVASFVGGLGPSGIWRGTSASPLWCGIQGGGGRATAVSGYWPEEEVESTQSSRCSLKRRTLVLALREGHGDL